MYIINNRINTILHVLLYIVYYVAPLFIWGITGFCSTDHLYDYTIDTFVMLHISIIICVNTS